MATPHLDPDTLAAYVDGRLEREELGRVDRHIDSCTSCRRELSSLAAVATQPALAAIETTTPQIGRYQIERELGAGAMGVVLRAFDPELARAVAIKVVRELDAASRDLVRAEARALARLRHPNVVTVYDVIVENDRMYIAMELVEGDTLRGYCKGRPTGEVLAACVHAARGLRAAHEAGIVHRDVKPENVLCTRDGEVRVSDFGLARVTGDAPRDGTVSGTPAYMAPEVLAGAAATTASDQFSLCMMTYEMITGVRPDREAPAPHAALPAWVWRVLERGLAHDPAARYPSLGGVIADLEHDPRVRRRRRALLGVGAAAALATGAIAVKLATPSAPRCEIDDSALGEAWDQPRRDAVDAALARVAGVEAARLVHDELDDYAHSWLAVRREACAATRERGEQSELQLARRVACLDRGRRELGELSRVLASGDDKAASAAGEAIGRLRDPYACTGALDGERAPGDVVGQSLADQQRAVLDRAGILHILGKLDDADALIVPLVPRLEAMHLPQLAGEALLVHARVENDRGHHDRAEDILFDALAAAERGGDDRLIATVWVEIVMTTGPQQQRFELARSNTRAADAALARIEPGAQMQMRYDYTVGAMLLAHGETAAARKRFEAGLAIATADPRRRLQTGLMHVGLCDTLRQQGDSPGARDHCAKGIALLEAALGREHRRLAIPCVTAGAAAFAAHDLDAAEKLYQRGIAIFEKHHAEDQLAYAVALSNLGSIYASRDDIARARALFTRALAVFDAHYAKHPQRLVPLQGLASVALRTGDATAAVDAYEQVRQGMAAVYTSDAPALATVEYDLALSYHDAKQPQRAQAILDGLVARMLAPGKEQWMIAARALDESAVIAADRKDYAAAVALRERALAALAHIDDAGTRALIERALGQTYLAMHRAELALPPLERAHTYFDAHAEDDYDRGLARLLLAAALDDVHRDRERARQLVHDAIVDLGKAHTGDNLERFRRDAQKLAAQLH